MSISFSQKVLSWFDLHGRRDLPWQHDRTPYRVWVSEIMLQQTQVITVIAYYKRFIQRFPTLADLASSPADDVLHLWSGLGYYARARNLHDSAKIIFFQWGGAFPKDINRLLQLPGIGRSTAGAILSLSLDQRHPILDGNIKRVLSRYHAIDEWPGKSSVANQLWLFADKYTPNSNVAKYNQAMMDIGSTVCTRKDPNCQRCPLIDDCEGYNTGAPLRFPGRKPKRKRNCQTTRFMIIVNQNKEVLLERRPNSGIWGGLWSFPECPVSKNVDDWIKLYIKDKISQLIRLPKLKHQFTHFELFIEPYLIFLATISKKSITGGQEAWVSVREPKALGLAAPVSRLLNELAHDKV